MSTATRISLREAETVALPLLEVLGRGCERIEPAGSIRRRRLDVGDIEIVAVPRRHMEPDGMFDSFEVDDFQVAIDNLLEDGVLASHPTDPKRGQRYSKLIHAASGIQVDLFSARPETFGMVLLIRTGPADYSRQFVTDIKRIGWHVANGAELHRGGAGCGFTPCDVVPTREEEDVYAVLGHPWIDPRARADLARLGR